MSDWMNLFSVKMGVDLRQLGCCKSCARIPKLHRKILNSNSRVLCRPHSFSPLQMLLQPWSWESGGAVRSWSGLKVIPKSIFSFISAAHWARLLLTMCGGFPVRITKKKKKKEFGEIKKLRYRQSHESSIILLPGMSRSRLFTLTSATSNLCLGLILAFQRHRIWPYHLVRVVFVVSPRAVIECGM